MFVYGVISVGLVALYMVALVYNALKNSKPVGLLVLLPMAAIMVYMSFALAGYAEQVVALGVVSIVLVSVLILLVLIACLAFVTEEKASEATQALIACFLLINSLVYMGVVL